MQTGGTQRGQPGKAFQVPDDEKAPPPLETESGQGWLEFKSGTREAATQQAAVTWSGSAALEASTPRLERGTLRGHHSNPTKDLHTHSTRAPQHKSLRPPRAENSLGNAFHLAHRFWVEAFALTPTLPSALSASPHFPANNRKACAPQLGVGRVWEQENCPRPRDNRVLHQQHQTTELSKTLRGNENSEEQI